MATIQEVLDQVGDDPELAQNALDYELANDNRTTLITKLEAIAAKEAPVSVDETSPDEVETIDEPQPPAEVGLSLADAGLVTHPAVIRDADVEVPADHDLATPDPNEEIPTDPIGGEQVEWLAAVSGTQGLALSINGAVFLFNDQMTANLKAIIDKTVVGLSL